MSDVKVERTTAMTRADLAQWFTDLGKELSGEGDVSFRLADGTVELKIPSDVRFEIEVEVDGDEVELEFELTWSTASKARRPAVKSGSSGS